MLLHALVHRLKNDSLLRNSIFIMASTIVTSGIGYLYWVLAARMYSAHDIGLASAFISAMTLTSIFANMGIGSALVQLLPRRASGHAWSLTLNVCIAIGILTSLIGGVIVAIALPLLSAQFAIIQSHLAYAVIFIISVIVCTVATLLDQTFLAERATSNMAVRNAIFALLKLPLMIVFVQIGALGIYFSWVLALAATVVLAGFVLIPRLKRGYCVAIRGASEQIRPMFSAFAGHHFINIGGILPLYLLPVFVAIRLSVTDNAYFYTTWMMGSVFFMVSPSVASALFSEGAHEASDVISKARKSILIISILLLPILLVFLVGGRYLMLVFGPDYPLHGLLLLMLLTISAVPDAITNVYVSLLRVQRRLYQAAFLNLSMATITLALAWILLPRIGIVGAGWAWLIAQSFGSLLVGTDILLSRKPMPVSMVAEDGQNSISLERKSRELPVEPSYLTPEAISLIDTAMIPIVGYLSREQKKKEEAISLIDTAMIPIVGYLPREQRKKEETISLIDTVEMPRVPSIHRTMEKPAKTPSLYPSGQFFKRVHSSRLIAEDEVK